MKKPRQAGSGRALLWGLGVLGGIGAVALIGVVVVLISAGDSEVAQADMPFVPELPGSLDDGTAGSTSFSSYHETASASGNSPASAVSTPSGWDEPAVDSASDSPTPVSGAEPFNFSPSPDVNVPPPTPTVDIQSSAATQDRMASAASSPTTGPPETSSLADGVLRWHESGQSLAGVRPVAGNTHVQLQYSWMCNLLPHIGHQSVYDQFDFTRTWSDRRNLQLTGKVISQFLNPGDRRQTWSGYPFEGMALTHFVGVSGVEDGRNVVAAKLPRSDPRAGVFGYDRVATIEEITDGASNTLMMIGSGEISAPWVHGGGATIRGAREPYFDSLTGFGSVGANKPGAMAMMADGSVRFISADVDPTVFRAMCTIGGGETVDISPWATPAAFGERGAAQR